MDQSGLVSTVVTLLIVHLAKGSEPSVWLVWSCVLRISREPRYTG